MCQTIRDEDINGGLCNVSSTKRQSSTKSWRDYTPTQYNLIYPLQEDVPGTHKLRLENAKITRQPTKDDLLTNKENSYYLI